MTKMIEDTFTDGKVNLKDVSSTHFRHMFLAGKKLRNHRSGSFFLRGVNKSGRRTHVLHKISSKTLTSKQYISFLR